jgi:hypothetical protein
MHIVAPMERPTLLLQLLPVSLIVDSDIVEEVYAPG